MAASSFFSTTSIVTTITLVLLVLLMGSSSAELSTNFYSKSCPKLFSTVKSVVQSAVSEEKRMGASLVRLFFHDCFVNVLPLILDFLIPSTHTHINIHVHKWVFTFCWAHLVYVTTYTNSRNYYSLSTFYLSWFC